MTAPGTVVPEPPAPALSPHPIAEEALAATPGDRRDLFAPLDVPPEPNWNPWPEHAACHVFSAEEQEALLARWHAEARERTYSSPWWLERARRVKALAMAAAPLPAAPEPAERDSAGIWPRPEEVMPDGPGRNAQGRSGSPENVPRSGRELAPEDSTGPESHGTDPAVAVASSGPGHTEARRDEAQAALARDDQSGQSVSPRTGPPMRSGTIPPPVAEPEQAPKAADDAAEDSDAEQFGAPDEPFWGTYDVADIARIVPPPETTEMTAIIEKPGEQQ